jgi:hypothetical protein
MPMAMPIRLPCHRMPCHRMRLWAPHHTQSQPRLTIGTQEQESRARPATMVVDARGGRLPRRRNPGRRVQIEPIFSIYSWFRLFFPRLTLAISGEGRRRGHESTLQTTQGHRPFDSLVLPICTVRLRPLRCVCPEHTRWNALAKTRVMGYLSCKLHVRTEL